MPRGEKQKLKLLYIADILRENTDEEHYITTQELIDRLERLDIKAERKSIYDDIANLQDYGMDIVKVPSRIKGGYYLAGREFELPELKMLVEAVLASKFITREQSEKLIKKIKKLTNRYEGEKLQRQVHVVGRIKADNKKILYSVDVLHNAILENKQVSFEYMEWNIKKELVPKRETPYVVSPYALLWKEENYYLIAYDEKADCLKHYRVDKIMKAQVMEEKRVGHDKFDENNLPWYSNTMFGMFNGEEETLSIQFPKSLIGVVIDRFGKDVSIRSINQDFFVARCKVVVSNQFFGWISGLGTGILIREPEYVAKKYQDYLREILGNYVN